MRNELIRNPVWFARNICRYKDAPLALHEWQIAVCHDSNWLEDRVALRCARQIGKSIFASFRAVHLASTNPHTTVHVFSRSWDQASNIFRYCRNLVSDSPEIARLSQHNRKHEILFKNGSRITHRTTGVDGSGCLGFSCENRGCVILDECAYIRGEAAHKILPIARNAGLIVVSTPNRPGSFFETCCRSRDFKEFHVPASLSPLYSREDIDRESRLLPPHRFRTDILAEFSLGGAEAVFNVEAVERAVDAELYRFDPAGPRPAGNRAGSFIWSLDPSRLKRDSTIFMIGQYDANANAIAVVAYHAFAGTSLACSPYAPNATFTDDPETVVQTIASYYRDFPPVAFYIDSSNDTFYEREFSKRLFPVKPCLWNDSSKERYIEHLSACFNANRIRIPNDYRILDELLTLSYNLEDRKDGSQRKRYQAGQDDYVDALAQMSLHCTVRGYKEWSDFIEVI